MKNKLFTSLILPLVALSLCSCSIFTATTEKRINVYNLDKLNGDVSSCKTGEVKARFKKDEGYVPYLSLKQYASLFESHYGAYVTTSFSKKDNYVSWMAMRDGSIYFLTQIDFKKKEVLTVGSLDSLYASDDDPRDLASLYYGNHTEYDGEYLSNSPYAHYSFADYDIDYFSYLGDYYLPLSFYDITYCFDTSLYFYYNYDSIYSSVSVDTFYEKEFQKGRQLYTVVSEMNVSKKDEAIPSYLVNLNSNLFLYMIDNFYGLKEYKGITSAKAYCESIGTYDRMFSSDGKTRSQAYAETLDRFDDNHTALVAGSYPWGGQDYVARQYGTGCLNRSALRGRLNRLRKDNTSSLYQNSSEALISDDGKTAMFLFDEFFYGSSADVFNDDGTVKDTARYHDSFFNMLCFFRDLKALGTVENVILDMSTNGGGVLGVLMKLLALISKTNEGHLYYLEAATQQVGIANTTIDSDGNSIYNTDDCYGDDFNIYLLTSDCSFSCGNAFPCLAQRMGCAKVIGQKSGGGECAVSIHYLPNGEYVYHSSNLHIGYYERDKQVFTGFEDGAEPDILISDVNDFFNINKLNTLIQND